MKIKPLSLLLIIDILIILLILSIVFIPSTVARIVLGLPFVLYFPGFLLMLVLFPRRDQMEGVERVALSFGLSIAIVPLLGLALNYTPWGITLNSVLYTLACFIFIMSIVGWIRTQSLPDQEKLQVEFRFKRPAMGTTIWDKTLSAILVIVVLGAIGMTGYLISKPKVGESFTEFYLLGPGGKAENYPQQLTVDETGNVTVGIINHENKELNYRIKVLIDNQENGEMGPILLDDSEKWEGAMTFIPKIVGDNQKVEFLLFKGDETVTPAYSLHIWISVKDKVK